MTSKRLRTFASPLSDALRNTMNCVTRPRTSTLSDPASTSPRPSPLRTLRRRRTRRGSGRRPSTTPPCRSPATRISLWLCSPGPRRTSTTRRLVPTPPLASLPRSTSRRPTFLRSVSELASVPRTPGRFCTLTTSSRTASPLSTSLVPVTSRTRLLRHPSSTSSRRTRRRPRTACLLGSRSTPARPKESAPGSAATRVVAERGGGTAAWASLAATAASIVDTPATSLRAVHAPASSATMAATSRLSPTTTKSRRRSKTRPRKSARATRSALRRPPLVTAPALMQRRSPSASPPPRRASTEQRRLSACS
mmetsp:Transcript_3897/g.9226  ORF Transcript_3897/g.9226 Transcript_3897/m.9226 type:complete len:308 (+) Transcript_3897:4422-5345(+)